MYAYTQNRSMSFAQASREQNAGRMNHGRRNICCPRTTARAEKVVGIDLGTANSTVAVMMGGKPISIPNSEGQCTTPSVVSFETAASCSVGQVAKRQAVWNPENTISSVKHFIGRKIEEVKEESKKVPYLVVTDSNHNVRIKLSNVGKEFAPEEITALILHKLTADAAKFLNDKVEKAVITVPAYFNDSQRQAIRNAGKIAGLNVLSILNEPTAAALAYGYDRKEKETILVLDLGGGSLGVSLVQVGAGVVNVLSTSGDARLGGNDFDARIVDYLAAKLRKVEGIDVREDRLGLQRLKEVAEMVKNDLSSVPQAVSILPFVIAAQEGPKQLITQLTRNKFEEMCCDLLARCRVTVEQALSHAGLDINGVDEVIMVGGASRIPAMRSLMKDMTGKEPNLSVNPEEAVALGAAVHAGVLAGEVSGITLLDVTPLSLDLDTRLIPRNTTLPTSNSETFSTALDGQPSMEINVSQDGGQRLVEMFAASMREMQRLQADTHRQHAKLEADVAELKHTQRQHAKLEADLAELKHTVTDEAQVGEAVQGPLSKLDYEAVMNNLNDPPTGAEVQGVLQGLRSKFEAALSSSSEQTTQDLYNEVLKLFCQKYNAALHLCDTSVSGFPTDPIHKVDIILSTCPKPQAPRSVLWSTAVALGQLKSHFQPAEYRKALGQLMRRVKALFLMQPHRKSCIGFVGSGHSVEVLVFQQEEVGMSIWRTGMLPVSLESDPRGLQALAALVSSPLHRLGFSPTVMQPFSYRSGASTWTVKPTAVLRADVRKTGSAVYECECIPGQTAAPINGVLKTGRAAQHEAGVIKALNKAHVPGVPSLLLEGLLPEGGGFLIMQPQGVPVSSQLTAKQLLTVVKDCAVTVSEMLSKCEIMHLDVAPGNIVMDASTGQGTLIDFHLSRLMADLHGQPYYSGSINFMAIARLEGKQPDLSGELESLVYCLLHWACDGALHWKHATSRETSAGLKLHGMQRMFEAKVLARCVKPELEPALQALRDLFFDHVYRTDVQAGEFIAVCKQHIGLLVTVACSTHAVHPHVGISLSVLSCLSSL